jgi:hypothetical protein
LACDFFSRDQRSKVSSPSYQQDARDGPDQTTVNIDYHDHDHAA